MNFRLLFIVFVALFIAPSCSFFTNKMNEKLKEVGAEQSRVADSLKIVIIKERSNFERDAAFAIKMDTVYSIGFKLAALADSLLADPKSEANRETYTAQLNFFRNYINKNFEYSDEISSMMITLDMGTKMKERQKSDAVPFAMDMMYGLIKPSIMQIIIRCRSQYPRSDSTAVAENE